MLCATHIATACLQEYTICVVLFTYIALEMLYHLYIAPKSRQASVTAQWLPAGAIGKKKKNARAHAGRQAKLRLDGSKLGQKRRGSDLGAM